MKSKFFKIAISILLIVGCILTVSDKFNNKNVIASSGSGKLLFITEQDLDISFINNVDEKYKNYEIEVINPQNLNKYQFDSSSMVAVDNKTLSNLQVKQLVKEYIKENFILFVGHSTIEKLSEELGVVFKNYSLIYSSNTGEIISNELINMRGEFSVLKYTENNSLKDNIETVHFNESSLPIESYLIPCLDFLIERNQPQPFGYSMHRSGTNRYYLLNSSDKPTSTYFNTSYRLYKDTSDTDTSKDYYILKTNVYFSKNGHYFTLQHNGLSKYQANVLDKKPTSKSGTTSYSFSIGYKSATVSVSYSGPKAKITLKSIDNYSSIWTVQDGTLLSNANFDSGDIFEFASEYSVKQGTKPEFTYRIHALDKYANDTKYATSHIYTS